MGKPVADAKKKPKSAEKKKVYSEIDDLFGEIKVKKAAVVKARKEAAAVAAPKPVFSRHGTVNDMGLGTSLKKDRKVDKDGHKLYTEEELNLNKGGGTEDCPFDCQCCF